MTLKVLDLFCGMGGFSVGFRRQGFICQGVDIADVGYPYDLIQTDIRNYHALPNGYDVVVASPPCNEFSTLRLANKKSPPHPEKGIELVEEAMRVINEANPTYWALENVNGSLKHLYPTLGTPRFRKHPYYLWGNFPRFLMPMSNRIEKGAHLGYEGYEQRKGSWLDRPERRIPLMQWVRAKIPLPISVALASACKASIFDADSQERE